MIVARAYGTACKLIRNSFVNSGFFSLLSLFLFSFSFFFVLPFFIVLTFFRRFFRELRGQVLFLFFPLSFLFPSYSLPSDFPFPSLLKSSLSSSKAQSVEIMTVLLSPPSFLPFPSPPSLPHASFSQVDSLPNRVNLSQGGESWPEQLKKSKKVAGGNKEEKMSFFIHFFFFFYKYI